MRRKNKQNKESKIDDSWLLPYADMLTLLLALFIVLFAMGELNSQKYEDLTQFFKREFSAGGQGLLDFSNSPIDKDEDVERVMEGEGITNNTSEDKQETIADAVYQEIIELRTIQGEMNDYILDKELANVLGTELTDEGLLITIMADISFDSGSADVKAQGEEIAKELGEMIVTDPPHQIVISGHADDIPMHNDKFKSNWELSVMRAVNFMGMLLRNKQLEPERFSAKGYGEHHPIVPNINEVNRAKNRRVEVLVLPNIEISLDDE